MRTADGKNCTSERELNHKHATKQPTKDAPW